MQLTDYQAKYIAHELTRRLPSDSPERVTVAVAGAQVDSALSRKIRRYAPRALAFNGKQAGRVFLNRPVQYGQQPERVGSTVIFVLPSTSAAARRFWSPAPWHQLASFVGGPG